MEKVGKFFILFFSIFVKMKSYYKKKNYIFILIIYRKVKIIKKVLVNKI